LNVPIPHSVDQLLDGRVTVCQPKDGYRAAVDPIFLAACIPAKAGDRVLDVGCGVGAAALCLAARIDGVEVIGFDRQEELIALARLGAEKSDHGARVNFYAGDLLAPPEDILIERFDHVMANPPYQAKGRGHVSPNPIKAAANVEGDAILADWVDFCLSMARDGGSVSFIHHFDRRAEVIKGLSKRRGGITVFPLWPKMVGEGAKRALFQIVLGGEPDVTVKAGLLLHNQDGSYTDAAAAILRDVAPLPLAKPPPASLP
jgi:tRNA1(Val) A37 N6-methylase TrmN6